MKCEFVSKTQLLPKPDFPSSPLEEGQEEGEEEEEESEVHCERHAPELSNYCERHAPVPEQ